MEYHGENCEDLPKVRVMICKAAEDVTIKVGCLLFCRLSLLSFSFSLIHLLEQGVNSGLDESLKGLKLIFKNLRSISYDMGMRSLRHVNASLKQIPPMEFSLFPIKSQI